MFKSQNFCHIASNNRNQVKVGVFVYRTTDDLATVLTSGYFNDRIIDINLHDLIIHEKIDSADATKVQRNLLCVTERTLENVGTTLIKSKWEGDIEQAIADIEQEIAGLGNRFVKIDGSSVMTAPLKFASGSMRGAVGSYLNGVSFWKSDSQGNITNIANLTESQFTPVTTNSINLGNTTHTWKDAYVARVITSVLNNGHDIAVPVTNSADTLALKSEVDLAANSGRMITDQGVWYAKMYAATVAPSAENGTNYADFSQVDTGGNPIIVLYERQNGAWVETDIIVPPAEYDGYVPITSKIWDIPEQAGQQGGRILWNHTSKDFTPYPMIVSFDGANITNGAFQGSADLSGASTVTMPVSPSSTQIVNKDYVDTALAGVQSDMPVSVDVTFDPSDANAPTITSDGRIIPNITASHEIIPGILALDQCEIVLVFEGQQAGAVILWPQSGGYTNSFELSLSSGNLLKLNGVVGVTTIDPTQKYYAKITRVGTTCTLSLSTDGTVFTTECSTTISSLLTTKYRIQTTVGATLYCAECYIVNNGIKIWQGVGSPGLHQRVETGHEVIEFQAPTAQNNYTWYRKYADGWVEQGGYNFMSAYVSGQCFLVNLPITMADGNYQVVLSFASKTQSYHSGTNFYLLSDNYTTTSFVYCARGGDSNNYKVSSSWEVKGMAQG